MNPQELKNLADAKFDRTVFLKNLRESAYAKLGVVHNAGSFTANPELICLLSSSDDYQMYVEDNYNTPILVNRAVLLDLAQTTYNDTMRWWATELDRGNRIRRAANV